MIGIHSAIREWCYSQSVTAKQNGSRICSEFVHFTVLSKGFIGVVENWECRSALSGNNRLQLRNFSKRSCVFQGQLPIVPLPPEPVVTPEGTPLRAETYNGNTPVELTALQYTNSRSLKYYTPLHFNLAWNIRVLISHSEQKPFLQLRVLVPLWLRLLSSFWEVLDKSATISEGPVVYICQT